MEDIQNGRPDSGPTFTVQRFLCGKLKLKKYNQLGDSVEIWRLDQFKVLFAGRASKGLSSQKRGQPFTPEVIQLTEFDSNSAKARVQASGTLSNYIELFPLCMQGKHFEDY